MGDIMRGYLSLYYIFIGILFALVLFADPAHAEIIEVDGTCYDLEPGYPVWNSTTFCTVPDWLNQACSSYYVCEEGPVSDPQNHLTGPTTVWEVDPYDDGSCGSYSPRRRTVKTRYDVVECPLSEPEHCSDLEKNLAEGEEGIDCGGPCEDPCLASCGDGSEYDQLPLLNDQGQPTGPWIDICWFNGNTAPGTSDNCPYGYTWNSNTSACTSWGLADVGDQDYFDQATAEDPNDDFEVSQVPDYEVSFSTTSVDNGDGTTTQTDTKLTEIDNGDGTVTNIQETTTNIIDNSTGNTITSVSNVQTWQGSGTGGEGLVDSDADGTPDAEPGETADGLGGTGDLGLGSVDGVDRNADPGSSVDWTPISNATAQLMNKEPFGSINDLGLIYDNWVSPDPQTPEWTLDFIPMVEPQTLSLAVMDPVAAFFRSCLALVVGILAAWTAIRPWRG